MKLHDALDELLKTFKQLRDPKDGCPWDREQDFKSIASCSVEEAYEVADAIEREDYDSLKSELGDLLFQIIFHSKMAEENKLFTLEDVISELNDKLVRRHPHIFDTHQVNTAKESLSVWEDIKAKERSEKKYSSLMDDVPKNLPGLTRAKKLQKRAARVGFDWKDKQKVFIKLEEEINELRLEHKNNSIEGISEELGDVMFTLVNLCRHYDIEPEDIIRRSNLKFETRFRKMETSSKNKGKEIGKLTIDELEKLWKSVK
jgi:ATP diphosphatase